MKLHSISVISRSKQLAVCVFMCVCACVGVCLHIFFLHMGVIWSFVIPCLHTHTLMVFFYFVVFLFVWTKCTLAGTKTWSGFYPLIMHIIIHPLYLSLPLISDIPHVVYLITCIKNTHTQIGCFSCSILSVTGRSACPV